MIDASAYSANLKMLKRYNYFYSKVAYCFMLSFAGVTAAGLIYFFPALIIGNVGEFLLQIVLSECCVIGGFWALYKKRNLYAPVGLMLGTVGILINSNTVGELFNVICVVVSLFANVPIFILNSKYHFLEQQEGFPDFSVLLTENKEKADNAMQSDPYAKDPLFFKNLDKNMDEIELSDQIIEIKEIPKNDYMDSV